MSAETKFQEWCVLELMGHRRLGGLVSEQEIAGAAFLRIDVPGEDSEIVATQFYSSSAVYCITPVSEEMARAVAKGNQPQPVQRWELPAPKTAGSGANGEPVPGLDYDDECEPEDDDEDQPF